MRGAQSFARIVLCLVEDDLAMIRDDEAFADILVWLARWRHIGTVAAAYHRLMGVAH